MHTGKAEQQTQSTRRLQARYSMRLLMLFVIVCCFVSAWVGIRLRQGWQEEAIADQLLQLGATVQFQSDWFGVRSVGEIVWEDLSKQEANEVHAALAQLDKLTRLEELYLGDAVLTEADIRTIGRCRSLQALSIVFSEVQDDHLHHLKSLKRLKTLDLTATNVSESVIYDLQASIPHLVVSDD